MEKNNIHGKAQVFGNVIFPKTDVLTNIVKIQFFFFFQCKHGDTTSLVFKL